MAPSRFPSASTLILGGVTLVSACSIINAPDDVNPGGAGGDDTTASQGSTNSAGGADVASSSASSASDGGAATTSTTQSGGGSAGGQGGEGGSPALCEEPADCEPTECQTAACEDGRCVLTNGDVGSACGPLAGTCQAAGTCDEAGECFVADLEGATCASCVGAPETCVCQGGACASCDTVAPINFFADDQLPGWELTGGWGLYTRFPRDRQSPTEVPIGKRVLGTDGNRSHPYPGGADPGVGGSIESSAATSPLTVLPAVLTFRSWHEDEGGAVNGRDNKAIVLRDSEGVETILVDCDAGIQSDQPFCLLPPGGGLAAQRAADNWDEISIPVPGALVGTSARVELRYASLDAAGGRERGWFIDALSAAGRCGCQEDADCAYLSGACSEAVCDEGSCSFTPRAGSQGDACGTAIATACDGADRCDAFGLCDPQHRVDGTACVDCGGGDCQACGDGACLACEAPLQTFDGLLPTASWMLEGGWQVRTTAPASATHPAVPFASPLLGTDGGIGGEETSTATTIPTAIPGVLTFRSWHVDEGGLEGADNKTITVLTEDGDRVVLVDCASGIGDEQPFCSVELGPRAANDFDDISIDTGAPGTIGTIVFGYDTGSDSQTFEQGWYIDDLNAVRCP